MSQADLPNELMVGAWMNEPEHWVEPTATVDDAFARMRRANVRHLLVLKGGEELVGVVTDRDLRRPDWADGDVMSVKEMYKLGEKLRVADVMTEDPITVEPSQLTSEAAKLMVDNKFNCLPVINEEKVVGILTSSDLLAALVHEVDPDFRAAREMEADDE